MNSTSHSKKRKSWCKDDEEEEDEIKMEKFFALIRSIRESRERMIKFGGSDGKGKVKNGVGAWKPQFQLEDFMEVDHRNQNIINGSQKHINTSTLNFSLADHVSRDNKKAATDDEREAEKGMNLSLSL